MAPEATDTYVCPISGQLMQQPVMLETGCIYDLDSIQRWFETAHTCPCTRLPVNPKAIAPLPELAAEIAAWHATQQTKIPSPKHEHLSVASFPLDDAHDQPDHPPPPPGLFLNDLPLQLAQLASCTDEPSTQLQHLQHLLHRLHTPRLQPDLSVDLVRHGAVPVLTSLLLHPTTPDSICVHVADILSILSTYPGVDAMLLQAVNASNLLPQPLVFSTTKHVTKCCTVTAKTLVALVSMLDPHAPGIKQHMASTLWALWLITPWEHLRCHLVQRTKALAVLRAHVTMHLDVIQRCGVANTGALVAACHVLRSLALVRAGAEAMLSNGTLHAMRSGLHIAAGKRNRSSSGIGVDDDCDQQQQQHDAVDDHRTKIVQHHPQWHTLAATLASALANACFMLRRGGSRAGGLSRLFGVGVHAGHAAQQFCQATAVDRVTLRAVRRMMRAAMEAYATPEHPLPDVLTMHAACALLRSVTTCPLACRAALAAGLGMLVLTVGCASQDEVVCLSSTRVALVMASECGDGGKVSMGDAGGVGMAATLMASYRDDRGMLGGQLLKSLLCMATVDLYTDERVWGGLMGLLGAGGDDETAHTTAHILLQILRLRPSASSHITYDHCAALRNLLLQLDSIAGGAPVQRTAAECLALFAADEGARQLLLKVGAPHALVATLRRATHVRVLTGRDGVLAQRCLRALCVLAGAGGVYLEEVLSACEGDRQLRVVVCNAADGGRRGEVGSGGGASSSITAVQVAVC